MNRITSIFKRIGSAMVNPIIVKELRSRMRGPRAFIILTSALLVMAAISYAMYKLVIVTSTWNYNPLSPQIGQTLFVGLAILEMLMICMVTPAITAGAISSEHENLTYEMLLTTPLKPTGILWGKLISALSYIFLLIFAAIPMASLVFIYGGVSPRDMVKALIVLFCTAVMLGTVGIFTSTWLKRTGRASVVSYLIVLFLIGAPTFLYAAVGLLRQAEPPRWILVLSPISALFSAISPSTSLGNSSLSMIGGLSMLMAGNIGFISTESIPRPLYHYTLPLYGLLTIVFYLLSTRLIRPARRWRIRVKELLVGLVILLGFIGAVALAFASSSDRYENVSIFSAPTPFAPVQVDSFVQQAVAVNPTGTLAVSDEEAITAFSAVIRSLHDQGYLTTDIPVYISRTIYLDPAQPDAFAEDAFILPENIVEGISVSLDDAETTKTIWLDDFFAYPPEEETDSAFEGGALILWGYPNPLKTSVLQIQTSIYTENEPQQSFTIDLSDANGSWEVIGINPNTLQSVYPDPQIISPEQPLSTDDLSAIYGFAILQAYTVDNPLPGSEIEQLYLVKSTDLATDPQELDAKVQAGIIEWLKAMPFTITWVENAEAVTLAGFGKDALVTFGNVVPHDDQSFETILDFRYNDENKTLVTYIFQQNGGNWQIVEFGGNG